MHDFEKPAPQRQPRFFRKIAITILGLVAFCALAWAAQPTAYTPASDFSDLETADPADGLATIGTKLDTEFTAIQTTTNNIRTNLALIQRDDGEVANESIGLDQLDDVLLANMGITEGIWATATSYAVDDVIYTSNKIYICLIAHTSGTFATDLAALKWELVADFTAGAMDITGLTALSGADSTADVLAIYDDSAAANKKITFPDLMEGINVLTAETAPAVADKLAIYDASGGTADGITLENALKVIDSLTAETAPATDDKVAIYDTSGTSADGMSLANLFKVIGSLTAETAVAVDDSVALYDLSETATNSMSVTDLFEVINAFTADASPDGAADYVATYDASASTVKKVLIDDLTSASSGIAGIQFFTASGTWTKESGASKALVISTGGGGGGGGADSSGSSESGAGGGGGGGATCIEWITSGLGSTETVTIGAAGAAGANTGTNGGDGGDTTFGTFHTASGGSGGTGENGSAAGTALGGGGASCSGGSLNVSGGDGQSSFWNDSTVVAIGGLGGSSFFAGGGRGSVVGVDATVLAGVNGNNYGSGGGGGGDVGSTTGAGGGTGGAGAVLVISVY